MKPIHLTFRIVAFFTLAMTLFSCSSASREKYRVIISTDIGGSDPDDNQSMLHLLMYSNEFDIEALVSSAAFGAGSKQEILKMIDLYESQLPGLKNHSDEYPSPDYLRSVTYQGRKGSVPFCGNGPLTEGSKAIIDCAMKDDSRPLWVLAWGGIEDVVDALCAKPEIANKIRVYWIGGPNKKWGIHAYDYLVNNFPDLWIIECNASYRGFITDNADTSEYQAGFYEAHMQGTGAIADAFKTYYNGVAKMGDTPSLLYLLGSRINPKKFNPDHPEQDHWGGSFEKMTQSPKYIITGPLSIKDTISVYSTMEWHISGPVVDLPSGTECFTFTTDNQRWKGYYLGDGLYMTRYSPKAPATLAYTIESDIEGFPNHAGLFVVGDSYPAIGKFSYSSDTITSCPVKVGDSWWTDKTDKSLSSGVSDYEDYQNLQDSWQGAATVQKYRENVMKDWAERFTWLKEN